MAKKFEITRGNAILNFSEEFCQSRCELVESESFSKVLEKFIKNQRRLETQLYIYLHERNADDFFLLGDLRTGENFRDMQLFSMTQRNQVTRVYSSLMLRKNLKNLY